MFYKKKLLVKNTDHLKVNISNFSGGVNTQVDENSLPLKCAKLSYNYKMDNGALKTSLGFEPLKFIKNIQSDEERELMFYDAITEVNNVWFYPYYNNAGTQESFVLAVSADSGIYFAQIISSSKYIYNHSSDITFTSTPNAIYYNLNGNDVMIMSSKTDGLYVMDMINHYNIDSTAPKISSMCRHYERIFAIDSTDRNRLLFSANMDPTNWNFNIDNAGYINLNDERGALVKVLSFNDYVYIFKEHGISKLSAYGDQTEFSISNLFVSSGKIYAGSVCLCGDRIIFLCQDGVYSFNGYSTTKLTLNIENLFKNVKNDNCCAAYFNGKYYLGLKLNFDDNKQVGCEAYELGYVNNALLEIDLKNGNINIVRGVDLKALCAVEFQYVNKLVAAFNGEHKNKLGQLTEDGQYFGDSLPKEWISSYSNLGYPNKTKKIRKVSLISNEDCQLTLKTDKEIKTYNIPGSLKTTTVYTNAVGEMFQFKFLTSGADAQISNAQLELSVSR